MSQLPLRRRKRAARAKDDRNTKVFEEQIRPHQLFSPTSRSVFPKLFLILSVYFYVFFLVKIA